MTTIVITIDKGVPLPTIAPRTSPWAPFADKLRAMQPGDSFFVGRATRNDLAGMVRYADRLGIKLEAYELEDDEIFLLPGVRVWRVDGLGEADVDPAQPELPLVVPGNQESAAPVAETTPPPTKANPASKFWRYPDGGCVRFKSLRKGAQLAELEEMSTPITEAEYKAWEQEQEL